MKQRQALSLLPLSFLGLTFLDQLTKNAIHHNNFFLDSRFLKVQLHKNYGLALGWFAQADEMIRNVLFTTSFALLFLLYLITVFYILKDRKTPLLQLGLTFYIAGILGNVIDRTQYGYVVDFINLKLLFFQNIAFNLADAFQFIGVFLAIFCFFYYYKRLWFPENRRKLFLIKPAYQFPYAFKILFLLTGLSFILSLFSYSFLQVYLKELSSFERLKVTQAFIGGFILISVLYLGLSFLVSLILSHREIGPIYAFRRFMQDFWKKNYYPFKLRKHDNHKLELEQTTRELLAAKEQLSQDSHGT